MHTGSEHQLERSDRELDLSLGIECGKGELASYNSTWTCFNVSLSSALETWNHLQALCCLKWNELPPCIKSDVSLEKKNSLLSSQITPGFLFRLHCFLSNIYITCWYTLHADMHCMCVCMNMCGCVEFCSGLWAHIEKTGTIGVL